MRLHLLLYLLPDRFPVLLHKRPLELTIRTLSPVRLRRRDALKFRRFLADHPGIELEYLRTLAWNHEAQLDGLLVNGLDPVPVRLARLFLSLLAIGGEESSAGLLPIEPTVDELALMVHATRADRKSTRLNSSHSH